MRPYSTTTPSMTGIARSLCPPGQRLLELAPGGIPRWFIPIGNLRVERSGFGLYPVGLRWRSWARRAALRTRIVLNGARHERRQDGSAGDWPLGDLLSADMPALSTAAVYVGTPGPDQKITVQLMDDRGGILGYAKYADSPRAKALISNEARVLEELPAGVAPRLVCLTPFLKGDLLVQTHLPGRVRAPGRRVCVLQKRFLERLVRETGESYAAAEHPFVEDLRARGGASRASLIEGVITGLGDGEWPLAWTHGDLSAWNMRWHGGECRAFDWEYGRRDGLAFADAPHALTQFLGLVRGREPRRAKRTVSRMLEGCLPSRYSTSAPALASLCALNALVTWYPPRPTDDYERWLTSFVEAAP